MTITDLITKHEQILEVLRGVERGEKWEWKDRNGFWNLASDCACLVLTIINNHQVRLAPARTTRPWTFETRPTGVVWASRKDVDHSESQIIKWKAGTAILSPNMEVSYQNLHDDWFQRDGSVCGEEGV